MLASARCGIVTLGLLACLITSPATAESLSAKDPDALEKACKEKWQDVTKQYKEIGCSNGGKVFKCELKGYEPFFHRACDAVAPPADVIPNT